MEHMPQPEQASRPEAHSLIAELEGPLNKLHEDMENVGAQLTEAQDFYLDQAEKLRELQERLAAAEANDSVGEVESPEDLRSAIKEYQAQVTIAKGLVAPIRSQFNKLEQARTKLEANIPLDIE